MEEYIPVSNIKREERKAKIRRALGGIAKGFMSQAKSAGNVISQTSRGIKNVAKESYDKYKEYNQPENILSRQKAEISRLKNQATIERQRNILSSLRQRQRGSLFGGRSIFDKPVAEATPKRHIKRHHKKRHSKSTSTRSRQIIIRLQR